MGTFGWRKDHTVGEWLEAEGWSFDFYQAIRLLQLAHRHHVPGRSPHAGSPGTSIDPRHETIRFKSAIDLSFPASQIESITTPGEIVGREGVDGDNPTASASRHTEVTVNFTGLAGLSGPLPAVFTEQLIDDRLAGRPAMAEFLDIFNHRLVSLLYRVREMNRIGFEIREPGTDEHAEYLFAIFGLGSRELRRQTPDEGRPLLRYAGLLAHQPRSMAGLENLLADYFDVPVKGLPFQGDWYELPDDELTIVGPGGRNNILNRTALLGRRVWDNHGRIALEIGPLGWERFGDFLPEGTAWKTLCALTRFYVGNEFDVDVHLLLQADDVPAAVLNASNGPLLGVTSWLNHLRRVRLDGRITLSMREGEADDFNVPYLPRTGTVDRRGW